MTSEEMLEEDELAIKEYMEVKAKMPGITPLTSVNPLTKGGRAAVVGDPYLIFAKGPRDLPYR